MSRAVLHRLTAGRTRGLLSSSRTLESRCACAPTVVAEFRMPGSLVYLPGAVSTPACRSLSTNVDRTTVYWGDQRRRYETPRKRSVRSLPLSVKHRESLVLNRRGMAIYTQEYMPARDEPKAYVFLCHDYGDHSSWFLRDLAVSLVEQGYGVYAMDIEGHGKSDGPHGSVSNVGETVNDVIDHFGDKNLQHQDKKCFLLGEGLGAALALRAYINQGLKIWDGILMISPMLAMAPRFKPQPRTLRLLRRFASRLERFPLVPLRPVAQSLLREPSRRQEALEDVLGMHGMMSVGTCLRLLDAFEELHPHFQGTNAHTHVPVTDWVTWHFCPWADLRVPLVILHGEDDQINDLNVSMQLYKKAKSLDKTYKTYSKMQHSLLGGESNDNLLRVYEDIHSWLNERSAEPLDEEEFEAMESEEQECVGQEQRVQKGGVVQSVRAPRNVRPTVVESWSPTKPTVPTHTVPKP